MVGHAQGCPTLETLCYSLEDQSTRVVVDYCGVVRIQAVILANTSGTYLRRCCSNVEGAQRSSKVVQCKIGTPDAVVAQPLLTLVTAASGD